VPTAEKDAAVPTAKLPVDDGVTEIEMSAFVIVVVLVVQLTTLIVKTAISTAMSKNPRNRNFLLFILYLSFSLNQYLL
jgi:hypothetical protein